VEVYEVDPLLCPRCGGTMEVVAVIERPAVACLPAGRSGRSSAVTFLGSKQKSGPAGPLFCFMFSLIADG